LLSEYINEFRTGQENPGGGNRQRKPYQTGKDIFFIHRALRPEITADDPACLPDAGSFFTVAASDR